MFTFGWAEIFLVGIIIIIVIGPKDLPKFIKQISLLAKNIRKISSDFILYGNYFAILFPIIPSGNFFNNYLCLLIFLPL